MPKTLARPPDVLDATTARDRRVAEVSALGNDPEFLERLRRAIEFFEDKGVNE